jgi:hypothetical protein
VEWSGGSDTGEADQCGGDEVGKAVEFSRSCGTQEKGDGGAS